jgi:hypothetical protein
MHLRAREAKGNGEARATRYAGWVHAGSCLCATACTQRGPCARIVHAHDNEHDDGGVDDPWHGAAERDEDLVERLDTLEETEDAEGAQHAKLAEKLSEIGASHHGNGNGDDPAKMTVKAERFRILSRRSMGALAATGEVYATQAVRGRRGRAQREVRAGREESSQPRARVRRAQEIEQVPSG